MTSEASSPSEQKDENIEKPLKARGAGAIFHIRSTDQFMFFLRDDKEWIPFPNMVDIIGGHLEEGETSEQAAMREFGEELHYADSDERFQPQGLELFKRYVDDRQVEQNIFGCELDDVPNLRLLEGQRLVLLRRDELATTEFAFNYNDVVREYAETV